MMTFGENVERRKRKRSVRCERKREKTGRTAGKLNKRGKQQMGEK
jgi:hypothetical protein